MHCRGRKQLNINKNLSVSLQISLKQVLNYKKIKTIFYLTINCNFQTSYHVKLLNIEEMFVKCTCSFFSCYYKQAQFAATLVAHDSVTSPERSVVIKHIKKIWKKLNKM